MDLKFDANGLIPAIVQDHYTKEVRPSSMVMARLSAFM